MLLFGLVLWILFSVVFYPDRVVVKVNDAADEARFLAAGRALGLARRGRVYGSSWIVVGIPAGANPDAPEDLLVMDDERRRLLEEVRALSPRQRDCVLLRFYLELSESEIAELRNKLLQLKRLQLQWNR